MRFESLVDVTQNQWDFYLLVASNRLASSAPYLAASFYFISGG
jgi:hypothetical protein